MAEKEIRKIIYFDKETIRNILQEQHHGDYSRTTESSSSVKSEGDIETSTKIKLDVPLISRISFLLSGRIAVSYVVKSDSSTTITSTELSEFEKLKPQLKEIKSVQLHDIENSSTSLRVAGGYLRIVKGGVEGVDTKEFKTVMDNYDGYDTYSISEKCYVRFNNSAFVSNYKRNDLLSTTMTLYCISVGKFDRERFDFIKEMSKMERLFSQANGTKTLSDYYPPKTTNSHKQNDSENISEQISKDDLNTVELYDVVYACINTEASNE